MRAVITNVAQVTTEWLTQILNEKRDANWGDLITVQEIVCTHHTSTWFADIFFLEVSYSSKASKAALNQLILKISKPDLQPLDQLYGRKEVEFYHTIATEMDDPLLAGCYDAVYDAKSGGSHILLQDLSETHYQTQRPLPPSRHDSELAIECLAKFHAHWWEHPRLGTDIGGLVKGETAKDHQLGLPHSLQETEKMFSAFVNFLGDRLSGKRRRLFEEVFLSWPFARLAKRFRKQRWITLSHGDAHAWNFLYPHEPKFDTVRIIDWQEWNINLGTNDLAEFMVLWWYPEHRARIEETLIRKYHQQLLEQGVDGYDWAHCWNDYRLSVIRIMLYPVWMYAENRSPTFWWPVLERGILAVQDLGCEELLKQE